MKSEKSKIEIGDLVLIIKGPLDKVGKVGTVTNLFENGAIVKLNENLFTPIQFNHLQKVS
ncbi:MAG: hypothetical protein WC283_03315 [Candidatus Paceibacterota bacterium]|jgi:hypothetical protein